MPFAERNETKIYYETRGRDPQWIEKGRAACGPNHADRVVSP
jgi:hypothetical protein